MRIEFDHGGFQRAAVGMVALGSAGAWGAAVAGARPGVTALVALVAAALPLGHGVLRARRVGRLVPGALCAAAALGGGWLVWWAFFDTDTLAAIPAAGLGFLAGLVATLGLLGSCLRISRDVVAEAIEAARPHLDGAGRALCERAAAAAAKIQTAATGAGGGVEARRAAAEVDGVARRVVLEIVALSRRQRSMAREAETPSAAELDARVADLDARLASATDALAREEYARAREALEDQRRRLETLRASADRVMARLHTDVAALEGAALAIAARGGAATAEDAAALAPLADRLRGASGDVDLETEAVREAASV
jgi:hypothetical protein